MKKHLAIFSPQIIEALFAGKKTIDSRLSKNRIAPYLQISAGDIVYVKPPGGDVTGQFIVRKVMFLEGFNKEEFDVLMKEQWEKIGWGNEKDEKRFLEEKREESRYITLIWIDALERFLTPPVRIRKTDNRAWVVLENQ